MIGLLAAVGIILLLCLATYFHESISLVEIMAWLIAVALLAAVGWRLLTGWMTGRGPGAAKPRGPVAEGLARLRRGDIEAAEQQLRQCWERNPDDVEAARGLAEIALRRGEDERFVQIASQVLTRPGALRRPERVALCHRQADICIERLNDRQQAVEALARIELDYPGTTDASQARRRIERILSTADEEAPETD